ncbi:MAG TPA: MBL fold metallo-hydrolase [Dehalococcoidia bacterium]|jgi:glyoxylase-like metal-dependent hydrolase (beta-lactamase superfamily II)|nr:MBL fold metallo-hydrolase [Dehalococcoidia bacterium]
MPGYKITVGNCEIISLTDAHMQFPWVMFFVGIPLEELETYRDIYPACWGDRGFATDAGAYAVLTAGKTILVDTGIGPGPISELGGVQGSMLDDMRAKGISPAGVEIVVHTHLHFDHVGWNFVEGKPTFPNATHYAPEADIAYFSEHRAPNPQFEAQVEPLLKLGMLKGFSGEMTLAPGVSTIPTPGHTPGHSSVLAGSGGDFAIITGDLAHHPAQVDRTEWSPGWEHDPARSAESRRQIVERLEREGGIGAFCHFPGEGFGRIVRKGNRRVFQAL